MTLALYLVYGDKRYVQEAIQSARSLKAHCPDLPIMACTDRAPLDNVFDGLYPLRIQPGPPLLTKAYALANMDLSDDARVLFLDTDTCVLGDVRPTFDLLERFDLALTHAFGRRTGPRRGAYPLGYQDFSSGVMLYQQGRVRALFAAWHARYRDMARFYGNNDQPALAEEIYLSNLNTYVLPPEFNVRISSKHYVSGYAYILHGRGARLEQAIEHINQGHKPRVWNPK